MNGMEDMAQEFLHKVDTGLPHRRFLEEIGKLSCDELATVLLMWHKQQLGAGSLKEPSPAARSAAG
jgi:hypothetical protein